MNSRMARYPTTAGGAAGATGQFTITLVRPGKGRPVAEHWSYGERAEALAEIGLIAERVPNGTELVLRDPEGNDLLRVAKLA
jgi:hypothetical protein